MDLPNMADPESIASYLIAQDYFEQGIRNANTVWMIFLALLVVAFFVYAGVKRYRRNHP